MAGAAGSVLGLALLIVFAAGRADVWHLFSFCVFGTTLILMYTSSFLYHGLRISEKTLLIFRKIDHIMIFMVIAGSYTPLCLIPLRGPWGWSLFTTVWSIAFIGVFIKIFLINTPRWVSTLIYLMMGWLCMVAIYPLVTILEPICLFWLVLGGVFYSAGALIYALKRPNPIPGILGFHEIWHLFVIMGSACHFWLSFRYLMYIH
jgi:hemolysin III